MPVYWSHVRETYNFLSNSEPGIGCRCAHRLTLNTWLKCLGSERGCVCECVRCVTKECEKQGGTEYRLVNFLYDELGSLATNTTTTNRRPLLWELIRGQCIFPDFQPSCTVFPGNVLTKLSTDFQTQLFHKF